MAADGAMNRPAGTGLSGRGARPLDHDRVARIRETLDPTADFAEEARRSLVELNTRCREEIACGDLEPCRVLLAGFATHLTALAPATLVPKGLFDSRGKRLKAYRARFDDARREALRIAGELDALAEETSRRNGALGALWNETRDAVATLDVHTEAASVWLQEQPADDNRLDGFRRRIEELDARSHEAILGLPNALAAQNADLTAREHLRTTATALTDWIAQASKQLGVDGKKVRKVTPSPSALAEGLDTLTRAINAGESGLASACNRRAEVLSRMERQAAS